MIPSLPRSLVSRIANVGYVGAFFVFLFIPLVVVAVFAFNDANYPAPPWRGFTLNWFVGSSGGRIGLFGDGPLLKSVATLVGCIRGSTGGRGGSGGSESSRHGGVGRCSVMRRRPQPAGSEEA